MNAVLVGLKSANESSEQLFSLSLTYRSLGAILGGIGAYHLFKLNIGYPWIYSAFAYFMVVLILVMYRQDYQFPSNEKWHFADVFPLTKQLINKPFFWASVFFATSALAPFLLWQYLFKAFSNGVVWGYLALQCGMLVSSKLARTIQFTDTKRHIVIVLNLFAMCLMPFFTNEFWILFILLILHVFLVGLQGVFFNANFHDNLPQQTRSTSESLMSAFDSTLAIPMLFLIGYFMDSQQLFYAFMVSVVSGLLALFFFVASRKV